MTKLNMLDSRGFLDFSPVWGSKYWSIIVGGRGTGKTYSCKLRGCKNYIEKGEQWVYLRRTEAELKELLKNGQFLADVAKHKDLQDYEWRMQGTIMQCKKKNAPKKSPWENVGFCAALSTAGKKKGETLPNVTLLEYDEFIIEDKAMRYLPDEFDAIFRFHNTLDRNENRVKVVFTSNACSPVNPVIDGFRIPLGTSITNQGFYRVKCGESFIDFYWVPANKAYMSKVENTEAYRLRAGTEYNNYAFDNTFISLNDDGLIGSKPSEAKPIVVLRWLNTDYTIWQYKDIKKHIYTPTWYINTQSVDTNIPRFCLTRDDMTIDTTMVKRNESLFQYFVTLYSASLVYFENPIVRDKFLGVLDLLGVK